MRIRSFGGLVLSLCCLAAPARGATYYVDPVNGSDTNSGSITLPKKSILGLTNMTAPALAPGDVVNCRTGVYVEPTLTNRNNNFPYTKWSGTSANPVTVQAYDPGTGPEVVVFDPGYPEFRTSASTSWVPCTDTGHHADEYISTATYTATGNDGAWGCFLNSNGTASSRLLTYVRIEDLRAENESYRIVPLADGRPGAPVWGDTSNKLLWVYRGPGVYWDSATGKIHARFSATHWNQPGVTDYSGATDPRTFPLSISLKPHYAFACSADYITFKNINIQNGGDSTARAGGSGSDYAEHVTFDHCNFYSSRNGFLPTLTKFLLFKDCVFDGKLPSYVCRSDVKDSVDIVGAGGLQETDGFCRMTQACLLTGGVTEDMEVDHCEFRNGHDGIHLEMTRPRLHDSLLENLNDEAVMYYGTNSVDDIRIYNNVIRKCMQAFSSSEGGTGTSTGARYAYRNIIDQRTEPLGYRQFPVTVGGVLYNDPVDMWRPGQDFKFNTPTPEIYSYQNTFLMPDMGGTTCSTALGNFDPAHLKTRRYMNNIYMVFQTDKPLYVIPDSSYPVLSDGNMWCRRINNPVTPLWNITGGSLATWADLQASSTWSNFFSVNGVGWETHPGNPPTPIAYPQFSGVADYVPSDGGTFLNSDFRLKSTSPAIGKGVDLTGTGWPDSAAADSTPDIGALPYGSGPVKVGVRPAGSTDGRNQFPSTTLPLAEAGDYLVVSDSNNDGFESVSFDGTGSSDPDGSIASYNWTENGQTISTASTFTKSLPIGRHLIYLTVTDNSGNTATDLREVTVTDPTTLDNIVVNPGLENGSTGWSLGSGTSVVTTPTFYGNGAIQITGGSSANSATQDVAIIDGSSVKFSCQLSTASVPSTTPAHMQITWLNSSKVQVGSTFDVASVTGTTGYAYYSTTQTGPSGAVYARVSLILDAGSTGGTAYFDELRVLITDNKALNGFMQRPLASSKFNGWTYFTGTPQIVTDATNSRSGDGVLQMVGVTTYHGVDEFIPVTQGQAYAVQAWVKTNAMPSGKNAKVELRWTNSSGSNLGFFYSGTLGGTNGYTKLGPAGTTTCPTGTGVQYLWVRMYIDSAATGGTAWFDDVYVK